MPYDMTGLIDEMNTGDKLTSYLYDRKEFELTTINKDNFPRMAMEIQRLLESSNDDIDIIINRHEVIEE